MYIYVYVCMLFLSTPRLFHADMTFSYRFVPLYVHTSSQTLYKLMVIEPEHIRIFTLMSINTVTYTQNVHTHICLIYIYIYGCMHISM